MENVSEVRVEAGEPGVTGLEARRSIDRIGQGGIARTWELNRDKVGKGGIYLALLTGVAAAVFFFRRRSA